MKNVMILVTFMVASFSCKKDCPFPTIGLSSKKVVEESERTAEFNNQLSLELKAILNKSMNGNGKIDFSPSFSKNLKKVMTGEISLSNDYVRKYDAYANNICSLIELADNFDKYTSRYKVYQDSIDSLIFRFIRFTEEYKVSQSSITSIGNQSKISSSKRIKERAKKSVTVNILEYPLNNPPDSIIADGKSDVEFKLNLRTAEVVVSDYTRPFSICLYYGDNKYCTEFSDKMSNLSKSNFTKHEN